MRIIIEGLWGVGKTTLCQYLAEHHGFVHLTEPDHEREPYPIDNLDEWYYQAHLQNYERSLPIEGNVVIERSVASVFAFAKSRGDEDPLAGRVLVPQTLDVCVLLAVQYDEYRALINARPHSVFANPVINSESFLRSYPSNLETYIAMAFPSALLVHIPVTGPDGPISQTSINEQVSAAITRYCE